MAGNPTKICSLKLFVDKNSRKVLFAEAGKEFVNFLFALLSVPVGLVIGVAGKDAMPGSCLGSVYDSVENLCTTKLLPIYQNNKESILTPIDSFLRQALGGGYVKGRMTYVVLDDLTVKPMNTLSIIDIFNKLKIEDVSNVEELVVDVGVTEFTKLMGTSFQSKTVLTDVFQQGQ